MSRRSNDSLARKKSKRPYRPVCFLSTEGRTERDYFSMDVFRDLGVARQFPKGPHKDRTNPREVLKRMRTMLHDSSFRASDQAWIVVDIDTWEQEEIDAILAWECEDTRHHLAISNPKFELFLVMHYENAKGCTTPARVDAALKRHFPAYDKRLSSSQYVADQVLEASDVARERRKACHEKVPIPGMTDVYLLVDSLIDMRYQR